VDGGEQVGGAGGCCSRLPGVLLHRQQTSQHK
jgi:hypothetical protein